MGKTRVGVVLREKIGTSKTSSRSTDLVSLTERYNVWCQRIRSLIQSLQKHHNAMLQMEHSRSLVAKSFATMSQNSPLWNVTGQMPGEERPASSVCSYSYVTDILSTKSKSYTSKYKQFVIDYALEWEKVVRTRIDNAMKTAEQLRRDLDHYQKKVEELRNTTNRSMTKGKQIKPEAQEKLKRNEEKLVSAKATYNKVAQDLCILIEEVTDRSWRDLHPLLIKVSQFDVTLAKEESQILASLDKVVEKLKDIATAQGISSQPRLKEFTSLKPDQLSTRPGGVAATTLTIESDLSLTPMSGMSNSPGGFDDMARPPGSVAPQGIGGFPVQIGSSQPPERRDSFSGNNPEPLSTLGMLAISSNSAPAPTLDDVYSSHHGDNASVYGNGALSAPVDTFPSTTDLTGFRRSESAISASGQYSRSMSMTDGSGLDDGASVYSSRSVPAISLDIGGSYPAPPSQPPPPPPSMPPPPPPSSSGFGSLPSFPPAPAPYAPYTGAFNGVPPSHINPFGPPPSQPPPPPPSVSYGQPMSAPPFHQNPTNPFG